MLGNFKDPTRDYFKSLGLQDYNYSELYGLFKVGGNYSSYKTDYPLEYEKLRKNVLSKAKTKTPDGKTATIPSKDLKLENIIEVLQDSRADLLIPENAERNFDPNNFINLEYLFGKKEIKDQISSQNDTFTYKKFFNNEFYIKMRVYGDVRKRGALEIITFKQDIRVNANYAHRAVGKKIYTALYNEDYKSNSEKGQEFYSMTEAELALYKNNIMIQTGDENIIMVYIPNQITKYQYDRLIESLNEIKLANSKVQFQVIKLNEKLKFGESFTEVSYESFEDEIVDNDKISSKIAKTLRKPTKNGTNYLYGENLKKAIIDKDKEKNFEDENEEILVKTTKENFYKSNEFHDGQAETGR